MSAPRAIRPDAELLDGRGAKRVARGEHHVLARVGEAARELADGGGLARAVHADHQQHEGLRAVSSSGFCDGSRMAVIASVSAAISASTSSSSLRAHLLAQLFEDVLRGVDADVRGQQARLEFIEHFGVDLAAGHQVREVVGKPRARPVDLRAHARENDCGLSVGQARSSRNEKGEPECGPPLSARTVRSLRLNHRRVWRRNDGRRGMGTAACPRCRRPTRPASRPWPRRWPQG